MTNCPVCGSSQVYGERWKVCSNCGIEFRHPVPVYDYKRERRGRGFEVKQRARALRQATLLKSEGIKSVLDYGCSLGMLREHFDWTGVEPNNGDREACGAYETLRDVPQCRYDCVVMSHVLEHLQDPVDILKHMHDYSDRLYIEVPNASVKSSKTAPGHVLVFDKVAMKNVLAYADWEADCIQSGKELAVLCSTIA